MGIKVTGGGTIVASGGSSVATPTRHAVDANHVYVWHCGAGCTNGSTVTADKGGANLSWAGGAGTLASEVSMFNYTPSLITTKTTSSSSSNLLTGTVSVAGSVSMTIEGIFQLSPWLFDNLSAYTSLLNINGTTDAFQTRHKHAGSNQIMYTSQFNSTWSDSGTLQFGSGVSQVEINSPHHVMMTWNTSSGLVSYYLDGMLQNTQTRSSGGTNRPNPFTVVSVHLMPFGGSVADVRISNVVRSQAYAIDATSKMRGL